MDFLNQFVDKGLKDRLNHVLNSEFGHVTYTEAVEILEKHNDKFEYKVSWGTDLQTEHERYLTEEVFKRPVFVTDYPKEIKAFYMKLNPDGKTVAAMDCLVPGIGEIIGGSQREDDYEMLKSVYLSACCGQAPKAIHDIVKFEACHCNNGAVADLLNYIMYNYKED